MFNFRKAFFNAYDRLEKGELTNFLSDLSSQYESSSYSNTNKLNKLIKHVVDTVPFYKGFSATSTLQDFPVLNKSLINDNYNDFISNQFSRDNLIPVSTSGSTGIPFTFLFDGRKKNRRTIEVIFYNGWANYDLGDKHILCSIGTKKNRLKSFLQNQIITSPLVVNVSWFTKIRDHLKKREVDFAVIYASLLKQLAEFCKENGDNPDEFNLKGIIATSENMTEETRADSENVFGCPVLSRYSSLETGVIAHECKEGKNFHLNRASYHIELLSLDNDEPAKVGEFGRLVITDLFSYGMPLLRYDIGDIAISSNEKCKCGRKGPIFKKIGGRLTDNLLDNNGELISWGVVNTIIWKYSDVKEFRLIQNSKYQFDLILSLKSNSKLLDGIVNDLKELFGPASNITLKIVDNIEPLKSGKRPYIINNYIK